MSAPVETERTPEAPSPLALAMARRDLKELALVSDAQAAIESGVPRIDPQQQEIRTTRLAFLNDKLLNSKDNPAVAREINLHKQYELALIFNDIDGPIAMQYEKIRKLEKQGCRLYIDLFVEPVIEQNTEYALKNINRAEELATEKGIATDKVYEDEDLYEELMRRTYETPEKLAEHAMAHTNVPGFRKSIEIFLLRKLKNSLLMKAEERGITHNTKLEEQMEAFLPKQANNPEFTEMRDSRFDYFKKAAYLNVAYDIERFWGEEGLDSLSPKVKAGIKYYQEEDDFSTSEE